ncbi:MAG: hypothetical protein A4E28_00623 [Methanocella sp. PtaU1.Bin125]|nr:MAG: hypothetical protein A4E28_00623 [Methanocella sp. PtaU1.Bin125]
MGRVFGYLGGFLAILAAVWLLLIVLVPCSVSAIEARPELRCGNTVMGMEYVDSGMGQALFHRQTLAADEAAALAIDFPAASGDGGLSIAQTGADTTAAASTGFFFSNFQFSPVVNVGAAPVGAGQFGKPSPVKTAAFTGKAVMYPEMVVRGNLLGKGDLPAVISAGFSFPPAQAVVANETVWALGKIESDRNALGLNAIDKGLPVILSAHKFDFVSTPEQISKASILMRLWRNTHQGSMLNFMYEGDAAYPEWIAPVKNPMQLIDCGDSRKAIKSALEMTRPGKYLSRSFWSL